MIKRIMTDFLEHGDVGRFKKELTEATGMDVSSWKTKKWLLQVLEEYFRSDTGYHKLYKTITLEL